MLSRAPSTMYRLTMPGYQFKRCPRTTMIVLPNIFWSLKLSSSPLLPGESQFKPPLVVLISAARAAEVFLMRSSPNDEIFDQRELATQCRIQPCHEYLARRCRSSLAGVSAGRLKRMGSRTSFWSIAVPKLGNGVC